MGLLTDKALSQAQHPFEPPNEARDNLEAQKRRDKEAADKAAADKAAADRSSQSDKERALNDVNKFQASLQAKRDQEEEDRLGKVFDISRAGWTDADKAHYKPLVDSAMRNLGRAPTQGEIEFFNGGGGERGKSWKAGFDQSEIDYQKQLADKAASDLRQGLNQQATDYRKNIPGLQEEMMNPQMDSAKRQLAENIHGVKTAANQRGLLYSGIRQGQESNARGVASSAMAGARANANAQTQAQADAYDKIAAEGNIANQEKIMSEAKQKQADSNNNYALALQARQQNFQNETFGKNQDYQNSAFQQDLEQQMQKFNNDRDIAGKRSFLGGLGSIAGGLLG